MSVASAEAEIKISVRELLPHCREIQTPVARNGRGNFHTKESVLEIVRSTPFDSKGCQLVKRKWLSDGYPMIRWSGKKVRLHRLIFEIFKGPIPEGKLIRHWCDVRTCISPAHLLSGTMKDNVEDSRRNGKLGTGHRFRKINDLGVIFIRRAHSLGVPFRVLAKSFQLSLSYVKHLCGRTNSRARKNVALC